MYKKKVTHRGNTKIVVLVLIIFRSIPEIADVKAHAEVQRAKTRQRLMTALKNAHDRHEKERESYPGSSRLKRENQIVYRRARKTKHFRVLYYCFYCELFFRFMFGL